MEGMERLEQIGMSTMHEEPSTVFLFDVSPRSLNPWMFERFMTSALFTGVGRATIDKPTAESCESLGARAFQLHRPPRTRTTATVAITPHDLHYGYSSRRC